MNGKITYIVPPDEGKCIAMRVKSTIVFFYPVCEEILKYKPKVVTRSGKTVYRIGFAMRDGEKIIVGELDGVPLTWDISGRHISPYEDSPLDLYCAERYWDRQWRDKIKMSNGEFAVRYQRPHPYAQIPEPQIREI